MGGWGGGRGLPFHAQKFNPIIPEFWRINVLWGWVGGWSQTLPRIVEKTNKNAHLLQAPSNQNIGKRASKILRFPTFGPNRQPRREDFQDIYQVDGQKMAWPQWTSIKTLTDIEVFSTRRDHSPDLCTQCKSRGLECHLGKTLNPADLLVLGSVFQKTEVRRYVKCTMSHKIGIASGKN